MAADRSGAAARLVTGGRPAAISRAAEDLRPPTRSSVAVSGQLARSLVQLPRRRRNRCEAFYEQLGRRTNLQGLNLRLSERKGSRSHKCAREPDARWMCSSRAICIPIPGPL
jgi:hypothetical protein